MNGLQFDAVSFRYPGADRFAVHQVDLDTQPGEITWLLGPLGAGTTTMLLLGAGLAPRLTDGTLLGRVTMLGQAPGEDGLLGRVAYLGTAPSLQLSGVARTVREEVGFTPANLGWPRGRIFSAADRAIDRLGIGHLTDRDPTSLSGGEVQRVLLAALLAAEPDYWLLDEPMSALDGAGRDIVLDLLHSEARNGAGVLIASEDTDTLVEHAGRLLIMKEGEVFADGPPRTVLQGEDVGGLLGGGPTSVAELARAAHRLAPDSIPAPPWPLTANEAVAQWRR